MNIGFDIDGTLTDFEQFIFDHAVNYFYKKFGMSIVNPFGYDVDEVFDIEKTLINRNYSAEDAKLMASKMKSGFWNNFFVTYCLGTPFREGARETLKTLSEHNNIFIISSRDKTCAVNLKGALVRRLTQMQFIKNRIKYDKMVLLPNDESKIRAIEFYKIDIFVDDKPFVINRLSKFTNVIGMRSSYNKGLAFSSNVNFVNGYGDNELLDIINEFDIEPKNKPNGKRLVFEKAGNF